MRPSAHLPATEQCEPRWRAFSPPSRPSVSLFAEFCIWNGCVGCVSRRRSQWGERLRERPAVPELDEAIDVEETGEHAPLIFRAARTCNRDDSLCIDPSSAHPAFLNRLATNSDAAPPAAVAQGTSDGGGSSRRRHDSRCALGQTVNLGSIDSFSKECTRRYAARGWPLPQSAARTSGARKSAATGASWHPVWPLSEQSCAAFFASRPARAVLSCRAALVHTSTPACAASTPRGSPQRASHCVS